MSRTVNFLNSSCYPASQKNSNNIEGGGLSTPTDDNTNSDWNFYNFYFSQVSVLKIAGIFVLCSYVKKSIDTSDVTIDCRCCMDKMLLT